MSDKANVTDDGVIIMRLDDSSRAFIKEQADRIIAALTALTSRPASAPTSNTGGQRADRVAPSGELPHTLPNYGKAKGQPIVGASMGDLEYYANGCRKSIADKDKARFHDKERAMLAAIEAEIQRQNGPASGGVGGSSADGNGGPDESEIPFSFIETRIDRA